jgi:hypothetical protein
MMSYRYKGYEICPEPAELENGRWTHDVSIWNDQGHTVSITPFGSATTFGSEQEAIFHCLNFGKQIVDGKHPGLSVARQIHSAKA